MGTHGLLAIAARSAAEVRTLDAVGLAAVVAVYALVLAEGPWALRVVTGYAVLVLASSLASPVASATMPQWLALTLDDGARYWLFPILAYLTGAGWLLVGVLGRQSARGRHRRAPAGASRGRRLLLAAGGLLGTAVVVGAVVLGMPADWRYRTYPPVSDQTALRAFARARPGQKVTFPIEPPGWTMVLVKR